MDLPYFGFIGVELPYPKNGTRNKIGDDAAVLLLPVLICLKTSLPATGVYF